MPINAAAFYFVPKEKTNNATGLINLARNIGGSFGIANVTTMLDRRAQFHQSILVGHLTPLNSAYQQVLEGSSRILQTMGSSVAQATAQAYHLLQGNLLRQSMMLAFIDNFWLMGVTCLAMIPLMFLMKKTKPQKGEVVAP